MNPGKTFEQDFGKSVEGFFYLRLKDSAGFGAGNDQTRFTSHQICDAVLYAYQSIFLLELKSSKGTSFSFAREPKKQAMIKFHQIKGLCDQANHQGVYPMFVFNFRERHKTYLLFATSLRKFMDQTEKQSINEQDIIDNGGLEIASRKLVSHYRYDVAEACRTIVERGNYAKENI